jgi:hypothetical protein
MNSTEKKDFCLLDAGDMQAVIHLRGTAEVTACMGTVCMHVFGKGLHFRHNQYHINPIYQHLLYTIWQTFARGLLENCMIFGVAIISLMSNDELMWAPQVMDMQQYSVYVKVDKFNQRVYRIIDNKDGKQPRDMFVLECYPPKRDGRLTSPLSALTEHYYLMKLSLGAYSRTVRQLSSTWHVISPQKPSGGGAQNQVAPTSAFSRMNENLLAADDDTYQNREIINSIRRDRNSHPNLKRRRVDEACASDDTDDTPPTCYTAFDTDTDVTNIRVPDGFDSHGIILPTFNPTVSHLYQNFESAVGKVLHLPREYWSDHDNYSKHATGNNVNQARLDQTIAYWADFIETKLNAVLTHLYSSSDMQLADAMSMVKANTAGVANAGKPIGYKKNKQGNDYNKRVNDTIQGWCTEENEDMDDGEDKTRVLSTAEKLKGTNRPKSLVDLHKPVGVGMQFYVLVGWNEYFRERNKVLLHELLESSKACT